MDGGVIAAQEEAHKQEMIQQVLSPIFLNVKTKILLPLNGMNI